MGKEDYGPMKTLGLVSVKDLQMAIGNAIDMNKKTSDPARKLLLMLWVPHMSLEALMVPDESSATASSQ